MFEMKSAFSWALLIPPEIRTTRTTGDDHRPRRPHRPHRPPLEDARERGGRPSSSPSHRPLVVPLEGSKTDNVSVSTTEPSNVCLTYLTMFV